MDNLRDFVTNFNCYNDYSILDNTYNLCNIKEIDNEILDNNISNETMEQINKEYQDIILKKKRLVDNLNNFNNWTCEAGINNLVLRIDGSVYPTSGCNVGKQLGNWHNGFFQFRRTGLLCTQQSCWCGPDIMINKTYGKKQ